MKAETWLNAADAIDAGFVDASTDSMNVAACIHKDWWKNIPDSVLEMAKEAPEHKHVNNVRARMSQTLRRFQI